ncbi:MAG: YhaN family protein [Rhodospirillales bacterium]
MRFRRLDLIRYGHFTDCTLAFPAQAPDLHILFGPNEAGKSTALSAIDDLLFGFGANSTYDFLHPYNMMRLGSEVSSEGATLSFRRRKGKTGTLLTEEELPHTKGEAALAPFLAGADKAFFTRMFSLDHQRLRQGGREILASKDDVGQLLFAAGAGLAGLRQGLLRLEAEAEALWGPRKKQERRYTQVRQELEAAEAALREASVSANAWETAKRAFDVTRTKVGELTGEREAADRQGSKLARIRRVYGDLRRAAEIEAEIAALGQVPDLPADARQILEQAQQAAKEAGQRIEELRPTLDGLERGRDSLKTDPQLLQRAEEIGHLHERRIVMAKAKADLPNRREELAKEERELGRLLRALGWEDRDLEGLTERLPTEPVLVGLRGHYARYGVLVATLDRAQTDLARTESKYRLLEQRLAAAPPLLDLSLLDAVARTVREAGDPSAAIDATKQQVREAEGHLKDLLRGLRPLVGDLEGLRALTPPDSALLKAHRDRQAALRAARQEQATALKQARDMLSDQETAKQRLLRQEKPIPPEEILAARKLRDAGWSLIRCRYVAGEPLDAKALAAFAEDETALVGRYEAAVKAADARADLRFERAEAAAKLEELTDRLGEQSDKVAALQVSLEALDAEAATALADWQALWPGLSKPPLDPEVMPDWLARREEALDRARKLESAERSLVDLEARLEVAKDSLLYELSKLGQDPKGLETQSLASLLALASELLAKQETLRANRERDAEDLAELEQEVEQARAALKGAEEKLQAWQEAARIALEDLDLDSESSPEAVEASMEVIAKLRQAAAKADEIRLERIGKIERDFEAFRAAVEGLVAGISDARDAFPQDPEASVLRLETDLAEAQAAAARQGDLVQEIAKAEAELEAWQAKQSEAQRDLARLRAAAGSDDLAEAVAAAEVLALLRREQAVVQKRVEQGGDGLSRAELEAECDGFDPDRAKAEETTLAEEKRQIEERLGEAREALVLARQDFEAIGGGDAAARAAARREEALAELRRVVERYLRLRSAALLLRWGLERFRREQQGPLLSRAGSLFQTLTDGAFAGLEIDYDEADRPQLFGRRADDARVAVAGMSSGTADQLYLALRVASVENYLRENKPLPFVADDLFINFDDRRAAAGLRVLADLAKVTQVLIFTHHRHLVDLARQTLGDGLSVVTLPERGRSTTAAEGNLQMTSYK